ncbi:MAG TPA: hypothetical protein VFT87_01725 [Candidatus Saccharimonadales bacterium]|nr:hypothetical protein [Candidatus Saccharimonadales bacterium]
MKREARTIRVVNAALGKGKIQGRLVPVIRGVLLPEYFGALHIPDYQRAAMIDHKKHVDLFEALSPEGIGVPEDMTCCDRTMHYKATGASTFTITTANLIVLDGHQRTVASWARLEQNLTTDPLGVKIFFGTTLQEEIQTFYQVNRLQTKVHTHVHLRNRSDIAAATELKEMAEVAAGFPTVQWDRSSSGREITGHMLFEVACVLHGYPWKGDDREIIDALGEVSRHIGTDLLVHNVRLFFKAVQRAFAKEKLVEYRYRIDLLRAVAKLFAEHSNFWEASDPKKLRVLAEDINKLSTVNHKILHSTLGRGATSDMLSTLFQVLNRQRETNQLQRRNPVGITRPERKN